MEIFRDIASQNRPQIRVFQAISPHVCNQEHVCNHIFIYKT
jgi:hypothetical protein